MRGSPRIFHCSPSETSSDARSKSTVPVCLESVKQMTGHRLDIQDASFPHPWPLVAGGGRPLRARGEHGRDDIPAGLITVRRVGNDSFVEDAVIGKPLQRLSHHFLEHRLREMGADTTVKAEPKRQVTVLLA